MKTETTLDRPLGATPLLSANILLPEGLCKESFIDSKGNCVAVQLAAIMKSPLDSIEQEIDQLYKEMTRDNAGQYEVDGIKRSWREMGVNSKIIAQLGVNHGMNVYVLSQGRKIASYTHSKKANVHFCVLQSTVTMHGVMKRKRSVDRFRTPISNRIRRHKRLHMISRLPGLNIALGNLILRV